MGKNNRKKPKPQPQNDNGQSALAELQRYFNQQAAQRNASFNPPVNPNVGKSNVGKPTKIMEEEALKDIRAQDPDMMKLRDQLADSYEKGLDEADDFQGQLAKYMAELGTIDPQTGKLRKTLWDNAYKQSGLGGKIDDSTRQLADQMMGQANAARGSDLNAENAIAEMNSGMQAQDRMNNRNADLTGLLQSGQSETAKGLELMGNRQAFVDNARAQAGGYLQSGLTDYNLGQRHKQYMAGLNQGATPQMQYMPQGAQIQKPYQYSDPNAGFNFGGATAGMMKAGVGGQPGGRQGIGQSLLGMAAGAAPGAYQGFTDYWQGRKGYTGKAKKGK